ncbi:GNAT family N-acetyltransferase [Stakelama tenebrarum]|uniref:GNAT family N-acetyltransferase n=1 Tax=Stakelama tenebrarum TaxID=2711215 RepID=A0A6G6Y3A6_9SPHN|nr:GNAT family N-acetyltransferase [Sphingosinithalassobacter tenebrarum]QIG79093.1 GNAT family N-acetyltransferase [Sphingosinithalassobacter tenebrarum]
MNAVSEISRSPEPRPADAARPMPLKFEVGARTLMAVSRSLVRVPLSLEEAREGRLPALPPLEREAHGYSVTSLPEDRAEAMVYASGGMLPFVRQRYTRWYTDLTGGYDAWLAGLSGNTRQGLKRKAKKIEQISGGDLDIRRFRTAGEMEDFHDIGRRIALRTYQEKLLGSGLPDTPEFLRDMVAKAAADSVRAWLLYIAGEPAAYLYCPVVDGVVLYAFVGHDPAFNDLSPGAVLQREAFRDLFAEGRYKRFDFTEGDGQHKRTFATGGVPCVDLLLLRPSLANRATMAALGGFNRVVAGVKGVVMKSPLKGAANKVRRG